MARSAYAALALYAVALTAAAAPRQTDIVLWNRMLDIPSALPLVLYAMETTLADYGDFKFSFSDPIEQADLVQGLADNSLNNVVGLLVSTPQRERALRIIPVPTAHGLLGLRVCLIRAGEQSRFTGIESVTDWRERGLSIGQVNSWPDSEVLTASGITVVRTASYRRTFDQLLAGDFDCFARSAIEVFNELAAYQGQGIELEPSLAFYYPQGNFFFVSKANEQLAERLERGLRTAVDNGFYAKHLHYYHDDDVRKLRLAQRQIMILDNPLLTDTVRQLQDSSILWLDLDQIADR